MSEGSKSGGNKMYPYYILDLTSLIWKVGIKDVIQWVEILPCTLLPWVYFPYIVLSFPRSDLLSAESGVIPEHHCHTETNKTPELGSL